MMIEYASLATFLYTMFITVLALAQGRFRLSYLECSRSEQPAKYWINIVYWTLASISLYSNFVDRIF
jgi:hypothetical protein